MSIPDEYVSDEIIELRREKAYLSTKFVWENLDGVTDQETRPSTVVEDVVDEDESNLSPSSSSDSMLGELGSADGPDAERSAHTGGGEEEKRATTELVNEETHGDSSEEVDDVKDTVDLETSLWALDTSSFKDLVHVVRDETVARPLREESKRDENDKTVAVTLGLEQLNPSVLLELLLESDGFTDFLVFDLDELVISVTASVCLGEDVECLLVLALLNEVTWRFRDEPDGEQLDAGRSSLNNRWDSPGPCTVDLECAVSQP